MPALKLSRQPEGIDACAAAGNTAHCVAVEGTQVALQLVLQPEGRDAAARGVGHAQNPSPAWLALCVSARILGHSVTRELKITEWPESPLRSKWL